MMIRMTEMMMLGMISLRVNCYEDVGKRVILSTGVLIIIMVRMMMTVIFIWFLRDQESGCNDDEADHAEEGGGVTIDCIGTHLPFLYIRPHSKGICISDFSYVPAV